MEYKLMIRQSCSSAFGINGKDRSIAAPVSQIAMPTVTNTTAILAIRERPHRPLCLRTIFLFCTRALRLAGPLVLNELSHMKNISSGGIRLLLSPKNYSLSRSNFLGDRRQRIERLRVVFHQSHHSIGMMI